MTAILLALGASAAWGASDFMGGLRARAVALPTILLVSQGAGLVVAVVVLLVAGGGVPLDPGLGYGFLGGLAAVLDLGMIYMVLARGPVILIAPIGALGASIPVAFGLAGGDPVSASILAGLALALLGSVAASYEPEDAAESAGFAATVPLALAAAVGVGLAMLLLERASEVDPLWGTGALRVGGFIGALAVVGAATTRRRSPGARIGSLGPALLASLALVGLFDVLADIGYAVATTSGSLSTVAVLSSMYPVITVTLGYVVLRERVFPIQVAGVGLALAGVALLAAPAT
jgi:drug/metabolite transporter (DMT)-like permease